jgi:hypothetical protein
MRGTETVTVLRQQYDHNGDPVGPPVESSIENCIIWPRTSTENDARGIVPISGLAAWMPAGADIRSDDTARVRGEIYQVEGVPARHRKFSGRAWGVLVAFERVGVEANA